MDRFLPLNEHFDLARLYGSWVPFHSRFPIAGTITGRIRCEQTHDGKPCPMCETHAELNRVHCVLCRKQEGSNAVPRNTGYARFDVDGNTRIGLCPGCIRAELTRFSQVPSTQWRPQITIR